MTILCVRGLYIQSQIDLIRNSVVLGRIEKNTDCKSVECFEMNEPFPVKVKMAEIYQFDSGQIYSPWQKLLL